MASNTVYIEGMFGNDKTYFADSPVVINIRGLYWGSPVTSPFTVVRVEVIYDGNVVGEFHADTGGQTSISFDISSALRAIWSGYGFSKETDAAKRASAAISGDFTAESDDVDFFAGSQGVRKYRQYSLRVYTEYMSSDDGGVFTRNGFGPFDGGRCMTGWLTEWERSNIGNEANADASYWNHSNPRYGDASTKPTISPERVGRHSITSWVDINSEGTKSIFYAHDTNQSPDDPQPSGTSWTGHPPLVLRDSIDYTDFLFVNRRGALETCSAPTKESMDIGVETTQYTRVERPTFKPSRSLTAVASGGRRSWQMSSGGVTREWAEWWSLEFLTARRWWMKYKGPGMTAATFVPVIVEPAKKNTSIYDRTKQQMPHVDFTVTLALEG